MMRFLKFLAIFMALLVLAAVGVVVYFYSTSVVEIVSVSSVGVSAAQKQAQFDQIKASVADGSFQGARFSQATLTEAQDYALITYTIRLRNQCLVPIDMVEVRVVPDAGDVLQVGDLTQRALGAHREGDAQATLLTAKGSHSIRNLVVTYYVWGVAFQMNATSGS